MKGVHSQGKYARVATFMCTKYISVEVGPLLIPKLVIKKIALNLQAHVNERLKNNDDQRTWTTKNIANLVALYRARIAKGRDIDVGPLLIAQPTHPKNVYEAINLCNE